MNSTIFGQVPSNIQLQEAKRRQLYVRRIGLRDYASCSGLFHCQVIKYPDKMSSQLVIQWFHELVVCIPYFSYVITYQ